MTAITNDHPRPGSRVPTLSLVIATAAAGLSISSLVVVVAADDDAAVLPRQEAVAAEAPAAVAAPRDSATMIRAAIDEALAGKAPAAVAPRDSATMIRAAIDAVRAERAVATARHIFVGRHDAAATAIDAKDHPGYGPVAADT